MKKISLFVVTALLSTVLSAQHLPKLGIKAGLNIASLSVKNAPETDSRLGLHAGLLAHIHLAPQWAIQPEVQYSAQGMKQTFSGEDLYWKLDYINVPVMIQYMFNNGFRIEAGPQIGFLVSGKIEDENDNESSVRDDFKKTDISLGFGLNYLSYSGFGLGARYNLGLMDINDAGANEIKNRVLQLSLFYMLDSRHKAKSR